MANSSPEHQAVGVYLDTKLVYQFDSALDEETLRTGSVVLYDAEDQLEIRGALSYDPSTFAVSFLPNRSFSPRRRYTWTFAGADDDTMLPVKLPDGTPIPATIWIDFQTGGEYTPKAEVSQGEDSALGIISDGQSLRQREADPFKVVKTTPTHMDSYVDVLTDTISITFSQPLEVEQDWASLLEMKYTPLVRETFYFNDGKFKETVVDKIPGTTEVIDCAKPFQMPTGTWELSSDALTLTWTKDLEQVAFNANAFVRVFVQGELKAADGTLLNSYQDEEMYFLTQLFPLYTVPEAIYFRLNGIQGSLSEEVLLQHILTHSIRAYKLGRLSLITPSRAGQRFVEAMAVLQIIDDQSIQKEINRGKQIKLSELSVSYSFPRNEGVQSSTIRKDAANEADEAKRTLLLEAGQLDVQITSRQYGSSLVSGVYRQQLQTSYQN